MKRSFFLYPIMLMAGLLASAVAFAQDSKVTTGVVAFNEQRYDEAIAKLNEALADPTKLTPKVLPKAYYHLSQALLMKCQDTAFLFKDPETLFKAEEAWKKTKEIDDKKQYTKTAALTDEKFYATFVNSGAGAYGRGSAARQAKNETGAKKYFALAARFFGSAGTYRTDDVTAPMYQGYAFWENKDTAATIPAMQRALDVYRQKATEVKPETPDPTVASAALLLANLQLAKKDTAAAIKSIEFGREVVKMGDRAKLKPEQVTDLDATDKDLSLTELGIYQQNKKLYQTAKTKFEAAIAASPKDMMIRSAYAALVRENESPEKGLQLFESIIKDDPKNERANYEFASYYINAAAKLNEEQQKETNDDKLEALQKQVKELLGKGYPFVRTLYTLDPTNAEWLQQIVNIMPYLDNYDQAEYADFIKKLQAAQGGKK